jgi:hypothetical protein
MRNESESSDDDVKISPKNRKNKRKKNRKHQISNDEESNFSYEDLTPKTSISPKPKQNNELRKFFPSQKRDFKYYPQENQENNRSSKKVSQNNDLQDDVNSNNNFYTDENLGDDFESTPWLPPSIEIAKQVKKREMYKGENLNTTTLKFKTKKKKKTFKKFILNCK